jgi:hypothetical protein
LVSVPFSMGTVLHLRCSIRKLRAVRNSCFSPLLDGDGVASRPVRRCRRACGFVSVPFSMGTVLHRPRHTANAGSRPVVPFSMGDVSVPFSMGTVLHPLLELSHSTALIAGLRSPFSRRLRFLRQNALDLRTLVVTTRLRNSLRTRILRTASSRLSAPAATRLRSFRAYHPWPAAPRAARFHQWEPEIRARPESGRRTHVFTTLPVSASTSNE